MRCQVLVSHFISQFLGATLTAGHGLIPHVAWITWLCMTMVRREERQIPSDHYCCTILWPFFVVVVAWSMKFLLYLTSIAAPHLRLSTGISLVSVATPFMFLCQAFQTSPSFSLPFWTCSFPLLLSCIFQPLLYCRPTGERDMFAQSLTRRVWHLREQICSCKVNHTRGNYGLFVGICRGELGIWPGVLWPRERPHLQLLHFFHACRLKVVTDAFVVLVTVYSYSPVCHRVCSGQRRKCSCAALLSGVWNHDLPM